MHSEQHTDTGRNRPQVKICGLTRVEHAIRCAALGVDAVGCVFYSKSPRHLTEEKAREICLSLPPEVKGVGVFVNESFADIMKKVERCRLGAVQLHGQESPETVFRLRKENLLVVKTLFVDGEPTLDDAPHYDASAFLVECSGGPLPGGNAMVWNWKIAKGFDKKYPLILAGGLSPQNISDAVTAGMPDAVDVSSGVESTPGEKDLGKIESFMNAVARITVKRAYKKVY